MIGWTRTTNARQVRFGPGTAMRLRPVLRELGLRRALLVTSRGRAEIPAVTTVAEGVGRLLAMVFNQAEPHVPATSVQAAAVAARSEGVDCIVSVGGGSVIDLAKAVCFFIERERGTPATAFTDRPSLTHVAVPTNLTGAEATGTFAMTDPASRQKNEAGGLTTAPTVVVYDPELHVANASRQALESGLTAFAQCVEQICAGGADPVADALAVAAVGPLFAGLSAVHADPDDVDVRAQLVQSGALRAEATAAGHRGAVHGLATLLGGRCGVSHGVASGLLLGPVLQFNADAVGNRLDRLAHAMGVEDVPAAVEDLLDELGITERLSDLGVGDDDIEAVARLSQSNSGVRANPRPCGEGDARALVEAAF